GGAVGQVEFVAIHGDDIPRRRNHIAKRAAQLAGGTGDDDLHDGNSGVHQARLSRYQDTVASRPSSRVMALRRPSARADGSGSRLYRRSWPFRSVTNSTGSPVNPTICASLAASARFVRCSPLDSVYTSPARPAPMTAWIPRQ